MQREFQPENESNRSRGDLTGHRESVVVRRSDVVEDRPIGVGDHRIASNRDRHRATGTGDHLAQRGELVVHVEEVGHDLQHAGAGCTDALGDADQLIGRSGQGRRVRAG